MTPRRRPRHRTWASDTILGTVGFATVLALYVAWEMFSPPAPAGLVTLLGIAGGAWFGAVSGDKRKRDAEVERTADRAEAKADALKDAADLEHPGTAEAVDRAADAEGGRSK